MKRTMSMAGELVPSARKRRDPPGEGDESDSDTDSDSEGDTDDEDDQPLSRKRKGGAGAKPIGRKAKKPTRPSPGLLGPSPDVWTDIDFKLEPTGVSAGQRYLLHHSLFRPANFEAVKRHVSGKNMTTSSDRRKAFDDATQRALRALEAGDSHVVPEWVPEADDADGYGQRKNPKMSPWVPLVDRLELLNRWPGLYFAKRYAKFWPMTMAQLLSPVERPNEDVD
ncbi:hypothetical protein M431DRAFT_486530 [Trichoderma harzianum CBS 226.95]|uniref:Uncharacterized protein n=1 Tax=Trichoderma harzianum CBS 226.95 TaxID=983964 RepID=A0A2T3ZXJ2_TRIHA|nr:hypothetical protein M431DRAFT_486530 [Trichoderma harzianum CBS 226.95]PTB49531.1 hypothetical protein M431DRAFT_486530 [Trichoderma harzianum CBS 226.95]